MAPGRRSLVIRREVATVPLALMMSKGFRDVESDEEDEGFGTAARAYGAGL
jgi:hypothetical protein